MAPSLMFEHGLDVAKGWFHTAALDFVAKMSANVTFVVPDARVVHVNSSGEFEVDENTTHFRLTANGKVRHGEISLKVFYPGGKVFKDLTINSSAEISFSQSLTIKEEEKKKYIGTWKYEVKTKTAEGNYMLSIMTH